MNCPRAHTLRKDLVTFGQVRTWALITSQSVLASVFARRSAVVPGWPERSSAVLVGPAPAPALGRADHHRSVGAASLFYLHSPTPAHISWSSSGIPRPRVTFPQLQRRPCLASPTVKVSVDDAAPTTVCPRADRYRECPRGSRAASSCPTAVFAARPPPQTGRRRSQKDCRSLLS